MSSAPVTSMLNLIRDDLRTFAGYRSARSEPLAIASESEAIWLNANESPWRNAVDAVGTLRRYPQPQPERLRERLAGLHAVEAEQVLIGRGSDEAIDLLVRAFCHAGRDSIVIAPPTFGMYAVCARLQGAAVHEVRAIDRGDHWVVDIDAVRETALAQGAKIVFLCSPGNPTGELLPLTAVETLATALSGKSLVVVDEAYLDYAEAVSATTLLDRYDNIAVLRTLSKAHALAGARVGYLVADAGLIDVLRRCQAPYPVPAPCAEFALRALEDDCLATMRRRVKTIRRERDRVRACLQGMTGVVSVYASAANFLLVRFADADGAFRRLLQAGVVVRDLRATPQLGDALRITIATEEENNTLLSVIAEQAEAA